MTTENVKSYHLCVTNVDGKMNMTRENHGFNAHELIGMLEHIQMDIIKQMAGEVKPGTIKKTIVEETPEVENFIKTADHE